MIHRICIVAALLAAAGIQAHAQAQDLPKDIKGRWNLRGRATQVFALEDIQRKDDQSFTARLTWWTMDSKCAVRSEPITGRITPAGLAFDAATKCDVAFTADLQRGQAGWHGKAVTKTSTPAEVELTAD